MSGSSSPVKIPGSRPAAAVPSAETPRKVLVVRLDHLGDLLLTTPLARAFAQAGMEVEMLVSERWKAVLDGSPHVRRCHAVEEVAPGFPRSWLKLGLWMRRQRFDVVVLPYAKPAAILLASLLSSAPSRVAMWGGLLGRLTLHRCLRSRVNEAPRPFAEILLDCARALGVASDGMRPNFYPQEAEIEEARDFLGPEAVSKTWVGIHPGCAGNSCNLPARVYGDIARQLLEQTNVSLVITGLEAERALISGWPSEVLTSPRCRLALGERNLRQLGALMRVLNLLIVPSTGPLHLAAAVGTPTLSPFCPLPPLCAKIWGNPSASGNYVEPNAARCVAHRENSGEAHCDFRGEIPTADLVARARRILGL